MHALCTYSERRKVRLRFRKQPYDSFGRAIHHPSPAVAASASPTLAVQLLTDNYSRSPDAQKHSRHDPPATEKTARFFPVRSFRVTGSGGRKRTWSSKDCVLVASSASTSASRVSTKQRCSSWQRHKGGGGQLWVDTQRTKPVSDRYVSQVTDTSRVLVPYRDVESPGIVERTLRIPPKTVHVWRARSSSRCASRKQREQYPRLHHP